MLKMTQKIIAVTLVMLSLSGCIFVKDTADVVQHGPCLNIRHIFHIPPIMCWSADYALGGVDIKSREEKLRHPDPYVTPLTPANPPPPLWHVGIQDDLPPGMRPGLYATSVGNVDNIVGAVCWDPIDEANDPSAATPCDTLVPPTCTYSCFPPWRIRMSGSSTFEGACRIQKFTIRDRSTGIASDPYGSAVGGAVSNSFRRGITEYIDIKIRTLITGFSENIYKQLVGLPTDVVDAPFKVVIRYLLSLTLAIFFISMVLGLQRVSSYVAVVLMLKLFLVYQYATDWDLFNDLGIVIVEDGFVNELSNIMVGTFVPAMEGADFSASVGNVLGEIDGVLSVWIGSGFWKFILALMLTSGGGFAYAIIFLLLAFGYMVVIFKGLYIYFIALLMRYLLYSLAPIFIIFALFNETKSFFDGWIKQIINFSLQPIFIFAFIGMLHAVIRGFLDSSGFTNTAGNLGSAGVSASTIGGVLNADTIGHKVCWKPIVTMAGGPFREIYWWRICDSGQNVIDFNGTTDFPFNVWYMIGMLVVFVLLKDMMRWSVDMAGRISGGFTSAASVSPYGMGEMKAMGGIAAGWAVGGVAGAGKMAKGAAFGQRTTGSRSPFNRTGGLYGAANGKGTASGGVRRGAVEGMSKFSAVNKKTKSKGLGYIQR